MKNNGIIASLRAKLFANSNVGTNVVLNGELEQITVIGAFRSGTNYLKYLIEHNYHAQVEFHTYGWKHAGIPILAPASGYTYRETPIVWIVKNPYAFVHSLHRHYINNRQGIISHEDFDAFLTKPIVVFDSQLENSPQMRFSNPVQYWNYVYWNLQTLDDKSFNICRFIFEELIEQPSILRDIELMVSVRRKSDQLAVPKNQLKRLGGKKKVKLEDYETDKVFDKQGYFAQEYLDNFTDQQFAFMRNELDPWLMSEFGYEIV